MGELGGTEGTIPEKGGVSRRDMLFAAGGTVAGLAMRRKAKDADNYATEPNEEILANQRMLEGRGVIKVGANAFPYGGVNAEGMPPVTRVFVADEKTGAMLNLFLNVPQKEVLPPYSAPSWNPDIETRVGNQENWISAGPMRINLSRGIVDVSTVVNGALYTVTAQPLTPNQVVVVTREEDPPGFSDELVTTATRDLPPNESPSLRLLFRIVNTQSPEASVLPGEGMQFIVTRHGENSYTASPQFRFPLLKKKDTDV